jgi:membrane protease YdiL (CAAX protease family)
MTAATQPISAPLLGYLVGGFVALAVGIAVLSMRRRAPRPLASASGTRRAVLAIVIYTVFTACFARILSPALVGRDHSPWLLALADVVFVTQGLFIWVLALTEGRPWRDYGFRGSAPARMVFTLALGLGAAAIYSYRGFSGLLSGTIPHTADVLVFALMFASVGTSLPEEILFRGFLQGSLDGRLARWAVIVLPAIAFAVYRALWFLPGADMQRGEWVTYVLRTALPLGLWWGLMRDLGRGSLWPVLIARFVLQFGSGLAAVSSGLPLTGP